MALRRRSYTWVEQAEKPIDAPRRMACVTKTTRNANSGTYRNLFWTVSSGANLGSIPYNHGPFPLPPQSIHHHLYELSAGISVSVAPTIFSFSSPKQQPVCHSDSQDVVCPQNPEYAMECAQRANPRLVSGRRQNSRPDDRNHAGAPRIFCNVGSQLQMMHSLFLMS